MCSYPPPPVRRTIFLAVPFLLAVWVSSRCGPGNLRALFAPGYARLSLVPYDDSGGATEGFQGGGGGAIPLGHAPLSLFPLEHPHSLYFSFSFLFFYLSHTLSQWSCAPREGSRSGLLPTEAGLNDRFRVADQ